MYYEIPTAINSTLLTRKEYQSAFKKKKKKNLTMVIAAVNIKRFHAWLIVTRGVKTPHSLCEE